MIDKDSCNPERSRFVEDLIADIPLIEGYEKYGVTRENTGVIVTLIIQKMWRLKESGGIKVVEDILNYRFNELCHKTEDILTEV